jgi:hypothetical protein
LPLSGPARLRLALPTLRLTRLLRRVTLTALRRLALATLRSLAVSGTALPLTRPGLAALPGTSLPGGTLRSLPRLLRCPTGLALDHAVEQRRRVGEGRVRLGWRQAAR